MQLGFVSAILPDLSLDELLAFAASAGFDCVEIMCWPRGGAARRYAGVTHIDVDDFGAAEANAVKALVAKHGVEISGLGYYPNPLTPDPEERAAYLSHIRKMIAAAARLGVKVANTFIGRDHTRSLARNLEEFEKVWPAVIAFAEERDVRVGIENCPMLFTEDEWPGGQNLAISPAVWRRLFDVIPSPHFGLNFDPSHLIWQRMDYASAIREFAARFVHVHAKDARVDQHRLDQVGILATPLEFHTPKLPGLGQVDWGLFYSLLTDAGYDGAVCIEVEDRAYEDSLAKRKLAVDQSGRYLRQFM